jgi:hypothetical protein
MHNSRVAYEILYSIACGQSSLWRIPRGVPTSVLLVRICRLWMGRERWRRQRWIDKAEVEGV